MLATCTENLPTIYIGEYSCLSIPHPRVRNTDVIRRGYIYKDVVNSFIFLIQGALPDYVSKIQIPLPPSSFSILALHFQQNQIQRPLHISISSRTRATAFLLRPGKSKSLLVCLCSHYLSHGLLLLPLLIFLKNRCFSLSTLIRSSSTNLGFIFEGTLERQYSFLFNFFIFFYCFLVHGLIESEHDMINYGWNFRKRVWVLLVVLGWSVFFFFFSNVAFYELQHLPKIKFWHFANARPRP